jgi:hypothetical protein
MGLRRLLRGRRRTADRQPLTVIIAQGSPRARGDRIVVLTGDSVRPVAALTGALAPNAPTATAYDPPGAGAVSVAVVRRSARPTRWSASCCDRGPRERPSLLALTGGSTVVGGCHVDRPPQAPRRDARDAAGASWAVASAIGFGVGGSSSPICHGTWWWSACGHPGVQLAGFGSSRRAAEVAAARLPAGIGAAIGGAPRTSSASWRSRSGPRPGSYRSSSSPRRCSR